MVNYRGIRFTYDSLGNLVECQAANGDYQRYTYDLKNRLVQADIRDRYKAESWVYEYDPLGRRVAKSKLNKQGEQQLHTQFIWDGSHLVQEIRTGNHQQNAFTYIYSEPGSYEPLAQCYKDGDNAEYTINYFHCDQIGIPREMTDSDGKLIWKGRYDAWGSLIRDSYRETVSDSHQPFRLQNQYFDEETGLHYNFFRYYEPVLGRFITQDPIGLAGGDNLYRFEGTVQNQTDPLGLLAPALAAPWLLEGLVYVGTAMVGILVAAGIMDAKKAYDKAQTKTESISRVGRCNDPCSQYPSKDIARKIALQTAGIPVTSVPIAQNRVLGWEQYMYKSTKVNGAPLIVSHHPADLIHPCPHWHVGTAKMDNYNKVQKRNNGDGTFSWKYYKDYPTIEHRN